MFRWFLFLFLVVLFCSCKDLQNAYKSDPLLLEYLRDPSCLIQKDQLPTQVFETLSTSKFRNGTQGGLHWFKLTYVNEDTVDRNVVLELEDLLYEPVEFWRWHGTHLSKLPKKPVTYSKINPTRAVLTAMEPGSNIFYFNVNYRRHASVTVKAYNEAKYVFKEKMMFLDMGLYYGIVFMAIIVNVVCFLLFRDVLFVLYSISLLLISLLFLCYDGLWGYCVSNRWLLDYGDSLFCMLLTFIGGYYFARQYLAIEKVYLRSRFIELTNASITCFIFLCFLFTDLPWLYALGCLFMFYSLGYYVVMGALLFRKNTYAIFFFAGYFLIFLQGFLYILPLVYGIEQNWLSIQAVRIGGLTDVVLLMSAIIYRARCLDLEIGKMKSEIVQSFELPASKEKKDLVSEEELKSMYDLSEREIEVLHEILNGKTNPEISKSLFISVNTVKYHTGNIYRKMNVSNRVNAVQLLNT